MLCGSLRDVYSVREQYCTRLLTECYLARRRRPSILDSHELKRQQRQQQLQTHSIVDRAMC